MKITVYTIFCLQIDLQVHFRILILSQVFELRLKFQFNLILLYDKTIVRKYLNRTMVIFFVIKSVFWLTHAIYDSLSCNALIIINRFNPKLQKINKNRESLKKLELESWKEKIFSSMARSMCFKIGKEIFQKFPRLHLVSQNHLSTTSKLYRADDEGTSNSNYYFTYLSFRLSFISVDSNLSNYIVS